MNAHIDEMCARQDIVKHFPAPLPCFVEPRFSENGCLISETMQIFDECRFGVVGSDWLAKVRQSPFSSVSASFGYAFALDVETIRTGCSGGMTLAWEVNTADIAHACGAKVAFLMASNSAAELNVTFHFETTDCRFEDVCIGKIRLRPHGGYQVVRLSSSFEKVAEHLGEMPSRVELTLSLPSAAGAKISVAMTSIVLGASAKPIWRSRRSQ